MIGCNDLQTSGPRIWPDITMECQRFRVCLRKNNFVNPSDGRTDCTSLGDEYALSARLIDFTALAKKARQEYIIEVFHNNNTASLFRPIPITEQEATAQENEANLFKAEIISKIGALLEQMGESVQKKYASIKSKRRDELLKILEEVRFLFNSENIIVPKAQNKEFCQKNVQ